MPWLFHIDAQAVQHQCSVSQQFVTEKSRTPVLATAFDRIAAEIHEIGGQAVFLECEVGNAKLKAFYEKNGFVACTRRFSNEDGVFYLQMFRFLKLSATTTDRIT